jgi:crotonobetainyl-CoA:carnitine CoA-transferase CaiB-like acyl-CoA transferase
VGAKRPEYDLVPMPPAPGFGDSIGAMTIAGGIMGALFHRERTGEATIVDVSLLGTGLWAMGQAMALSLVLDVPWGAPPNDRPGSNPISRNYDTKDGRTLAFTCLQAAKYWPLLCDIVGRPELAADERFADQASLIGNSREAIAILDEVFATATLEEWRTRLDAFEGQWAVVQNSLEAATDPQTVANGYLQPCETADGTPFQMVAAPVQFDEQPAVPGRAPEFNEHGDEILESIGLDWDAIVDLKVRGIVA